MPRFGRFNAGQDSGPPSVGDETTTYRKSPIGYEEQTSAKGTWGNRPFEDRTLDALTSLVFPYEKYGEKINGRLNLPFSNYSKEGWNNEATKTHERIHQGQHAARLPGLGTERDTPALRRLIDVALSSAAKTGSSPEKTFVEKPAYTFETAIRRPFAKKETVDFYKQHPQSASLPIARATEKKADEQQGAFNNYMDLVQKIAPGRRHNVMAPMPEELQRGYINSGPGVEGFPLPEEQESVLSMIKRSLRGK